MSSSYHPLFVEGGPRAIKFVFVTPFLRKRRVLDKVQSTPTLQRRGFEAWSVNDPNACMSLSGNRRNFSIQRSVVHTKERQDITLREEKS